jgi:hypothetical protein
VDRFCCQDLFDDIVFQAYILVMDSCEQSISGTLLKALGEFNRGDWYQCHETLEDLWVGSEGEMRDLYQGILQLSVALHHWRNGNFGGAVSLLKGGAGYLRRVSDVCQRIDVRGLVAAAEGLHAELTRLGPERMAEADRELFPRMRLVPVEGSVDNHGQIGGSRLNI